MILVFGAFVICLPSVGADQNLATLLALVESVDTQPKWTQVLSAGLGNAERFQSSALPGFVSDTESFYGPVRSPGQRFAAKPGMVCDDHLFVIDRLGRTDCRALSQGDENDARIC